MPSISASNVTIGHIEFFSDFLWSLDYIPIASTVKCIADLFFSMYWKNSPPSDLSSYAFSYYQHLNDKPDYRYLGIFPIIGNMLLYIREGCSFLKQQIENHQKNIMAEKIDARNEGYIRELLLGTREQVKSTIECYCQSNQNLKESFSNVFQALDRSSQDHVVAAFEEVAEKGDANHLKAYDFVCYLLNDPRTPSEDRFLSTSIRSSIRGWLFVQVKTPTSNLHGSTWNTVKSLCDSQHDKDSVLEIFLEMLEIDQISIEKTTFIVQKLSTELYSRESRFGIQFGFLGFGFRDWENNRIFLTFKRLAERGKVEFMHHVGRYYLQYASHQAGIEWLERAARANHVHSIRRLGDHYRGRNIERAVFWYEKIADRDPLARSALDTLRREVEEQRRAQEDEQRRQRTDAERRERERQAREEERRRAEERNRAEAERVERERQALLSVPGTIPYSQYSIPADVQDKADEIARLSTQFEALTNHPPIPQHFICPVTLSGLMKIPVFDASHRAVENAMRAASALGAGPEAQTALNNRDIRHILDKDSIESHFTAHPHSYNPAKCPTCRHPEHGGMRRENLRIDTALQDEILSFLRAAVR